MSRTRLITLMALAVILLTISIVYVAGQGALPAGDDWPQEAHDAQHTGYTPEEPVGPWTYAWSWNGSDAQGKTTGNTYDGPRRDGRTVTGGGRIYIPAKSQGLFALDLRTGAQLWRFSLATVNGTPAYDAATGSVFAGGTNGTVYKLNAATGAVVGTFNAQQEITKPLLLANSSVFAVTTGGRLFSIDANQMTQRWVYNSGAAGSTPAAYSATRNLVVYGTGDLNVHAVNAANGTLLWKVKPTTRTTTEMCGLYSYDYRWPVIADASGVVFMRMRNPWNATSAGSTNAELRQYLINNPQDQTLFALDLNNGTKKFIPNVAPDGTDERPTCNGQSILFHAISAAPVVKTLPDGKQVAYIPFRSNQPPYDARWDATMGEMVLDNQTVPNYQAGDLRYIQFASEIPTNMITDEIHTISMAGSSIFHHHVLDVQSYKILDRSANLGLSFANMIPTQRNPSIIRWWKPLNGEPSNPNFTTRAGSNLETLERYYGEGFWIYQGTLQKEMINNPDLPELGSEEGSANRYVYVSNGMIIVQGPRGDIFALRHSGASINPVQGTAIPTAVKTATNTTVPTTAPTVTKTATIVVPTPTKTATAVVINPTPLPGNNTPTVTTLSGGAAQVGRYQKYELTFQISKSFPADSMLPYYFYDPADAVGVNGISIDGHFISPSGREVVAPAFYYQDYNRTVSSSEVLTPLNSFAWKVRFAPEEVGTYNYFITIQDKLGSTRYPASGTLTMQSVNSNSPGFVRVSPRDSRFMEFSNGTSFVPNAAGNQWWRTSLKSRDFENAFADFAANKINLTRIWDQNDGFSLTVEGHFDAYSSPGDLRPEDQGLDVNTIPKGTQMNQRGNYQQDIIIQAAERNGVYIQLCSHGDAWWIWESSIYNDVPASWTDPARLRYWQRNFRYRVARWGYSTSILAWEHWNELGHVPAGSDVWQFYQTYGQYQQQVDPYRHLRTTSQGSQAWSPAFWSTSAFEIVNYHDYMMVSRYPAELTFDAGNFVYRFAQCLRAPNGSQCGLDLGDGSNWQGPPKPIIWGELDTGTAQWDQANPQPKALHDMRWAGLFSPAGTSPIDWYFDSQSAAIKASKFQDARAVSAYFAGLDYAGKGFTFLSTDDVRLNSQSVSTNNPKLRVLAMRAANNNEAYAWVQNKDNARWDQPVNTAPLTATFTLPQMANGNYRVELWDTYSGQMRDGGLVAVTNGALTVSLTNLSTDMALKIVSTTQVPSPVPPTATLLPTATLAAPTATLVPPTATPVPPTATPVPPTATLVPPTATLVPPTATLVVPTATSVPPTATLVPPTATSVPPTATLVVPTATSTVVAGVSPTPPFGSGNAGVLVNINPPAAAPGQEVAVELKLYNVSDLYGFQAECQVDPTVLLGTSLIGGEGFNTTNSIVVDKQYQPDGRWLVAGSRFNPGVALQGNVTAFSLKYLVQTASTSPVICTVLGVNADGHDVPLEVVNGIFNDPNNTNFPPVLPTAVPTATALPPTPVPTAAVLSSVNGSASIPGAPSQDGITVALASGNTILAQLVTLADGQFQFIDVPVGSYTLLLSAPHSLVMGMSISVTADGQIINVGQVTMVMGDVDKNLTIDLQDAVLIGANFGLDGTLMPDADLNRDLLINIRDLVQVGSHFGMISPVVVPAPTA